MYFRDRREPTQRRVWDRETRLDRLFWSGIIEDSEEAEGDGTVDFGAMEERGDVEELEGGGRVSEAGCVLTEDAYGVSETQKDCVDAC